MSYILPFCTFRSHPDLPTLAKIFRSVRIYLYFFTLLFVLVISLLQTSSYERNKVLNRNAVNS